MLLKTEAIVLRTIKHRETSVISDLYTCEKGMVSVIANGVRKPKSRMGAALFQPSSLVEVVLYYKENAGLHRVKEIKISSPLFSIHEKIKKMAIAQFITEISKKAAANQHASPQLFFFLKNQLLQLEESSPPDSLQPIRFLLGLCPFLGITPDFKWVQNGFFDLKEGTTVKELPKHPHFLSPEKTAFLQRISQESRDSCADLNLGIAKEIRREILTAMLSYYKIHVDGMKELNSPEILRIILER